MPQNPDLIATKTVDGPVFIFDRTKHETKAPVGGVCKPDITLVGQSKEGWVVSVSRKLTAATDYRGTRSRRATS